MISSTSCVNMRNSNKVLKLQRTIVDLLQSVVSYCERDPVEDSIDLAKRRPRNYNKMYPYVLHRSATFSSSLYMRWETDLYYPVIFQFYKSG